MKVLSPEGLQKISKLQDKYKFQDTFEIQDPQDVIDFLENLQGAYHYGLHVDDEDINWINSTLEILTD